jgi:hypothetical protein
MRKAGVYEDLYGNGGRWELKQALRWAITGQVYKYGSWVPSDFCGFGFSGFSSNFGQNVIGALVKRYAPMHWPDRGKRWIRVQAVDRTFNAVWRSWNVCVHERQRVQESR